MSDNVQVAIRVRPLIEREKQKNERELWKVKDCKFIFQESSPSEQYCFDRVFNPTEENYAVYEDLCLPIVESVMQGFNGTIFAYGQTSSGKTFTMMGEHNGIINGVVQFSIRDVFKLIEEMPDREFLLRVSYLEIYNEKVYDLLSDKNEDLKILEDSYGIVKVNGLLEKIVQREEQIWDWMHKGQNKRRTGATVMNRNSSRSHSIFRMIIESRVKDQDAAVVNVSQLNLVDLAGSENLKQTNTKGERFKEGVHINLSLSTLIQVISQLSERDDQFINYRNSKLTRLLQNSLGGNALTAIICAVTPASVKETLSTINFAQRAKKIKNKPTKNEIFNEQALLKQYANKIKKLSEELQATKEQGKELAEKKKQNENLKRQIEALKANFVSQTGISKSSRRETWGGHLAARRLKLEQFVPIYPSSSNSNLATLEEEAEGEQEASDNNRNSTSRKNSCSSFRMSVSKKILNAETQTDFEEPIDLEELLKIVSDLKSELSNLECKLTELEDYTTLEKLLLKAESELQTENEILKHENVNLSKYLDELQSKSRSCSCSFENFQESSTESCLASRLSTSKEKFPKECQTSPLKLDNNSDSPNEQIKLLEQCNQELKSKIIELEASCTKQKETFEIAQFEWNAKTESIIKELESKHEIELVKINDQLKDSSSTSMEKFPKECQTSPLKLENNSDSLNEQCKMLEQCNQDLRSKIMELEASYHEQKEAFESAQSEWNARTQLIIKELELKHEIEVTDINCQLKDSKDKLNDLVPLQERYSNLEECNKQLRQKLCDLEEAHSSEIKDAEEKNKATDFKLKTVIEKLENHQKELAEIKLLFKECEILNLDDIRTLKSKYHELDECNTNLKQKLNDLKSAHCIELKDAEAKYEKAYSELLMMTKNLEAKEKELAEAQNQLNTVTTQDLNDLNFLQEKCSKLVQYNNDLRKKITDIENSHWDELEKLEENFKVERSEWESEILKKFKDLETEHQQELNDLEKRVSESHMAQFNERIQVYVKEACELREEVKHLKLSNTELLSTTQDQSNKIKELENLISEKLDQITQLNREKDQTELAVMEKYEKIITEYKSRQRQCRDINRQLRNEVNFYKEEIEKLRNEIKTSNCNTQLQKNISDLAQERDNLLNKNKIAKQEIHDLKINLKKAKMDLDEQIKVTKSACKTEELEEKCKTLSFELDEKKAKIISLESNNTCMIQEIKKLKEKFSRLIPCKCEVNTKGLKETLQAHSNSGQKVENEKLNGKLETQVEKNKAKKVSNEDASQKENNAKENEDPSDHLIGCGPADMIRCYRLEGIIHKKDKELKKLEKENSELKSELLTIKARPVIYEQKKIEVRNPELKRVPMSPLRNKNEDFTVNTGVTPMQHCGAVPKTLGKHVNIRERYKKISKPYDQIPKTDNTEKNNKCKQEHLRREVKENIKRPQTSDELLNMIDGNSEDSQMPECKQQ